MVRDRVGVRLEIELGLGSGFFFSEGGGGGGDFFLVLNIQHALITLTLQHILVLQFTTIHVFHFYK